MHDLFKNEELTDRVVNNLARMKGIERLVEPVPFSQDRSSTNWLRIFVATSTSRPFTNQ